MLVLPWSLWSFSVGLMTLSQPPVSCSRLQNRPQQPRIHQGQCSRWWVRCGNLLLFGSPFPLWKKEKEKKYYCRSAVSRLGGRVFDNPVSWGKKLTTMSSKKGEKMEEDDFESYVRRSAFLYKFYLYYVILGNLLPYMIELTILFLYHNNNNCSKGRILVNLDVTLSSLVTYSFIKLLLTDVIMY